MRECIDSYYMIMMGDLYLSVLKPNCREVLFSHMEKNAIKYEFEDVSVIKIDYNGVHCNENSKSEVFMRAVGIVSQLSEKGFRNLKIVENRVYREEETKVFEIESHANGAVSIKHGE